MTNTAAPVAQAPETAPPPPETQAPETAQPASAFVVYAARAKAGQGWLGVTDTGFAWVADIRDALPFLTGTDAVLTARAAFPGHDVEIVGE